MSFWNRLAPKWFRSSCKKSTKLPMGTSAPQMELLEDRTVPASFVYNGTDALAIELDNANEAITLTSQGGGNYTFTSTSKFTGTDTTGLTGNGTDTLTITSALALTSMGITDKASIVGTDVSFGANTGAYVDDVTITLNETGASVVTIANATSFTGTAGLNVAAARNISITADLSTDIGNIVLDADYGVQHVGLFAGVLISGSGIDVTTAGGNITIEGRGGRDSGHGVDIQGGAKVQAGGAVSVTGTGTGSFGPGRFGINLVTGTIQASGAAVTLTADSMAFDATSVVSSPGGVVTLQNKTAGVDINLGTKILGQLSLTDAELDRVIAKTVVIGRSDGTNSGVISVSQALTLVPNLQLVAPVGINLNNNISTTGTLTINAPSLTAMEQITTNGNTSLVLNGPLVTKGITASSLTITGATTVNQNGAWVVSGETNLTASGAVVLDNAGNNFNILGISGTVLVVNDVNGLVLSGASAINNINLSTSGALTQTGSIITGGSLNVVSTGDVDLSLAANRIIGPVSLFGANLSVANSRSLILGATSATGDLLVDTSGVNGNITQTGPITVLTGTAIFDAGTGTIVLNNALNDMGDVGPVGLIARNATLYDLDEVLLGSTVQVAGNLVIQTGGALTQSAALDAVTSNFTVNGDISLTDSGNAFGNLSAKATNISVTSAGEMVLNGVYAAGNLNIITAGGDVTQLGAVQAVAESALTTISTTGTFNVFLPNLLNDFITLTISSNDVTMSDANNLVLVNSTINGDLNIHAVRDVTLLGTITAGAVKVNAGLDIYGAGNTFGSTLDNNINIDGGRYVDFANFGSPSRFNGAVYFNGTIVVVAATGDLVLSGGNASIQLLLQTDGSIRQDVNAAYLNVSGNAVLIAKNDIVLNTPGNVITGSISSSATNITLLNTETLILGATTATGDLTLIAPAGVDQMASAFISLVNPLGVHGVIAPVDDDRIASVTVSGKTDIQAAGNMVNLPYLTNSLPVLAVVADSAMIGTSGAVNLLPSTVGRYILKAVGAITQTGVLTSDLLDMAAAGKFGFAPITLDSANKLRKVSVQGSTVVINNSRYLAMGLSFADSLKLNAQGDLFQVDPMRVNNSLTITAQDVSLQNADNSLFGTLTLNAASAKVFNTADFNLGTVTVTGLLALESSGAINQTGVLNAGQSTFTATGDITLNNAANAFGKLSAKAANIGVTSIGALNLDGVYAAGNLNITAEGDVTQMGPVQSVSAKAVATINAPGFNVTLPNLLNDFITLTVTANNLTALDANSLTVANSTVSGNLIMEVVLNGTLSNSNISGGVGLYTGSDLLGFGNSIGGIADLYATRRILFDGVRNTFGNVVNFLGTEVYIDAAGDLLVGLGNVSVLLNLDSTGSISQIQASLLNVGGTSSFSANGAISLGSQNNLSGPINASGTDITLVNNGPIILDTITANGTLTVSGEGITQTDNTSATGLATFDGGFGDILLGRINNYFTSVNLSGLNITLGAADNLELAGVYAMNNLILSLTGALTQTGPVSVFGTTDLVADLSVTLDDATNGFQKTVTVFSYGAIVLHAASNLITGDIAGDDVTLRSDGRLLVQGEIIATNVHLGGAGVGGSVLSGALRTANVTWNGPGQLNITGPQAYISGLTVAAGTVQTFANGVLSAEAELHVATGATINLNGTNQTVDGLLGDGSVVLGSLGNRGNLVINNTLDALFSGVISGKGELYKSGPGTLTLTNDNLFDGFVYIEEGTLQLGDGITNGGIFGDVMIEAGTLAFNLGSDQTFNNAFFSLPGAVVGNQQITLESLAGATLTLGGDNFFEGTTTILEGTLNLVTNLAQVVVNGPNAILTGVGMMGTLNAIQGVVAPGNIQGTGTLFVTGNASFGATSTLVIGIVDSSTFGLLSITDNGALRLLGAPTGGSLLVTVDPSFVPTDLETFTILTANPVVGQFAEGTVIVSGSYSFRAIYHQETVVLQRVPAGVLPGATPLVVSPGVGQSEVVIYDSKNQERARIAPMGPWMGGMRSAVGDVTGDGFADYIFAAQAGGGPRIVVIDGVSLESVASFYAYASTFRGGLYVATGDINGDGVAEIVTGAGATGGPHVQSFNWNGTKASTGFYAYGKTFTGGVTVATGDLNGDNIAEIITGAATNGGSHVRSFSANGTVGSLNFFAYASSFMGGVNVAAGDLNGDGVAEVITGAGPTGGSNVKIFDANANQLASFYSFLPSFKGGITVGVIDPTNSGTFDIVTGPGAGGAYYPGALVNLYDFDAGSVVFITNFLAYGNPYGGGIWVA